MSCASAPLAANIVEGRQSSASPATQCPSSPTSHALILPSLSSHNKSAGGLLEAIQFPRAPLLARHVLGLFFDIGLIAATWSVRGREHFLLFWVEILF